MKKIEFPVKYIEDNLLFNHNGAVWAYFRVEGFSYDFLDFEEKKEPFVKQFRFLNNVGLDLHYLVVPSPTNVSEIMKNTIEELENKDYPLKDNGKIVMQESEKILKNEAQENETSEYHHYIGVQLNANKNKYKSSNPLLETLDGIKAFFKGLNSPVYKYSGLHPDDILEEEIKAFKTQSNAVAVSISDSFSSKLIPATTEEMVNIIEKNFSVRNNNSDVQMRNNLSFGEIVEGIDDEENKIKAIRERTKDFKEFQETHINTLDSPKMLKLEKIMDSNEIESLYTQYFVISHMENVNWHPGFEWLYYLQLRLGFPVTISVRTDFMPNDVIQKRLSSTQLQIKDQQENAGESNERDTLSDNHMRSVIQMSDYFKESGFPAFDCSFIIKITGNTEEQINVRANTLKNEMAKFGIRVFAPYGEQFNLMYELIPGASKFNNDYKIEVDAGPLAGMMFGSTTNIGDNRGFYIGYTTQFNKPVFIQPDLAAKAYEGLGNVFDSIAILVAGATGKGKSFGMNLITYLSVLTGSQALIVDPKGDRDGWADGLPGISKKHINVWTLGADSKDAGSLDPFRTSTSIEEGMELTLDILSHLTDLEIHDAGYSLLSQAVEIVSETEDPCIGAVLSVLYSWYTNKPKEMTIQRHGALENVLNALDSLRSNRLSALLFGEVGQDFRVLNHDMPLQVLMIQNLNLPTENTTKLLPTHRISEALLISITAWTKQFMMTGNRSEQHKIILQDEASVIERNEMGSSLMDHIVRMGRFWNTTLLKGSQNASDYGRDVANIGMKFCFGLRERNEAEEMLEYMNLPVTDENVNRLLNLARGEALFQDIYGRTAEIYINPLFSDLFDAFDSSTSSEEDRERERSRTI